ncbi:MAG: sensor histidine kinase [Bryobacterales bacterium]|nr:sensor histidine kinase [Bryobacterales bacterium]
MPTHAEFANQEPLLVNTIGHGVGVLIFAFSLYFLLAASSRGRRPASRQTLGAAGLAFLWNFASLLVLACREFNWPGGELAVAIATSALSLLPALLLHLALGPLFPWIRRAGYAVGGLAVFLHGIEQLFPSLSHRYVLAFSTLSFGALTLVASVLLMRLGNSRRITSRLGGSMVLFLFAVSIIHMGSSQHTEWALEIALHHGGIVLALVLLLQDYRFALLDSFLRVLLNLTLAAVFVLGGSLLVRSGFRPATPFQLGLSFVALVLLLWLYVVILGELQRLLTRLLFGRREREQLTAEAGNETAYLELAGRELAHFLLASLRPATPALTDGLELSGPVSVEELPPARREALEEAGVEAVVPVRLPANEVHYLLLGYRAGGRRYLSEDLLVAERLAAQISERVTVFRAGELQRLVTQAELRALESQIQPHFLFNVLNTLYGLIPREAPAARSTVLNLADLMRYHLKQDRTYSPLADELRMVEAYLEIEKLRLSRRLTVNIAVDPDVLPVPIPVLSLEPLVENAVKHAVSANPQGGAISLAARRQENGTVLIRVEDTGAGPESSAQGKARSPGEGVGLANVKRRLELCYGAASTFEMKLSPTGSWVEMSIPVSGTIEKAPAA